MHISGTQPSSVILIQTKQFKALKSEVQRVLFFLWQIHVDLYTLNELINFTLRSE